MVLNGSVWLSTSLVEEHVQMVAANTVPEVPSDAIENLFEPFRRLHERSGTGHGLGLAIVRSIVAVHGGSVRATARTGGGLTVVVSLPGPAYATAAARHSSAGLDRTRRLP